MDKKLLEILCCPVSHKGLSVARSDLLIKVNTAIAAGKLHNSEGKLLSDTLSDALVTDDGKLLYAVNDGIPVLLEGESVLLGQLES